MAATLEIGANRRHQVKTWRQTPGEGNKASRARAPDVALVRGAFNPHPSTGNREQGKKFMRKGRNAGRKKEEGIIPAFLLSSYKIKRRKPDRLLFRATWRVDGVSDHHAHVLATLWPRSLDTVLISHGDTEVTAMGDCNRSIAERCHGRGDCLIELHRMTRAGDGEYPVPRINQVHGDLE